jgi:hypothetical protein
MTDSSRRLALFFVNRKERALPRFLRSVKVYI